MPNLFSCGGIASGLRFVALAGFLTAFGCGSSPSQRSGCSPGGETCACYPNKTCDGPLTCLSGVCVNPGGSGTGGASPGTGGSTPGTGGAGNVCSPGAATCACYPNQTCDSPLSCLSGVCVNAGSGGTGGTLPGTGGSSPGTGGVAPGTGGTTPGTGGTTPGTGGAGPEVSDAKIIDNMASCDGHISRVAGRDGPWYVYGDNGVNVAPNTSGANPAPTTSTPPTAFSQNTCAAWITGGCTATAPNCAFAGMGFQFKSDLGEYDVSAYQGISVDMEGDAIWVVVFMSQGRTFGAPLAASAGARATRTFRFADLVVSGSTPAGTAKDLTQVIKVEFTTMTPRGFGNAIWDVRFF